MIDAVLINFETLTRISRKGFMRKQQLIQMLLHSEKVNNVDIGDRTNFVRHTSLVLHTCPIIRSKVIGPLVVDNKIFVVFYMEHLDCLILHYSCKGNFVICKINSFFGCKYPLCKDWEWSCAKVKLFCANIKLLCMQHNLLGV